MPSAARKLFEQIVYAGLKPNVPGKPPERGKLGKLWNRLLNGSAPLDPLYLSNRTWKQKLRLTAVIGTPIAIVLGVATYTMVSPAPVVEKPPTELTPAEIAARTKIIPDDFKLPQNNDLQVPSVGVDKSTTPNCLTGTILNNTNRRYPRVEVVFDLTDDQGSQVGAVSNVVENLAPHATAPFRFPIPQKNAAFVLVREVRGSY